MQVTFSSPTICNCVFHIFGLSLLPNVVKETAVAMAINIQKKHSVSTKLPNLQPCLRDEARLEVCLSQIGPAGTADLLPRSGRNLRAILKVQLCQGRVPQDFQQVCGPIGTFGGIAKAPAVLKKGRWGYTGAPRKMAYRKKARLCHLSPNPPKTAFVEGPISLLAFRRSKMQNILSTSKNLSMINITKQKL